MNAQMGIMSNQLLQMRFRLSSRQKPWVECDEGLVCLQDAADGGGLGSK
jgi:hypothetical protein